MNLQERLLQNEIKHLGQIIQTLSYELIVLQDFLKDEYGSKFENFRRKLSRSSSGSHRSQSHKHTANISGSDPASNGRRSVNKDDGIKDKADDLAVVGENSTNSMDDSFDESGNEYDNAMSNSDSETSVTLRDPLEIESNVGRKGGRRRTRIWKFFDKIIHSNNKFSARCHLCKGLVSSRAVRMVEHRLKCKRKLHANQISTIRDLKPDLKEECPKDKKVEKSTNNDNNDQESSDAEEMETSNISNDRDNNESSGSQDKGYKKSGRMLDTIWHYFDIVYQNSMKKAKCKSCGQYISPKAVRLRQHKMTCKGAGVTKANDNQDKD